MPLSYLGGQPFTLTERKHLVLDLGRAGGGAAARRCASASSTRRRATGSSWVKHCDIPPLFQQEVIRSALALKLHCFEDTGAIVAAMTTSIPESPGSGRTWDYRYCWLRDAYYVLSAFRLLGQFEEREQFVHYLLNVAGGDARTSTWRRSTAWTARSDLEERILPTGPATTAKARCASATAPPLHPARHLRRDGAGADADLSR